MANHQLARSIDPAWAAERGKLSQNLYLLTNTIIDNDRSPGAILLNVVENPVSIFEGECSPFQPHALLSPAFRRAAARRSAKWASTASCGMAGRLSFNAS